MSLAERIGLIKAYAVDDHAQYTVTVLDGKLRPAASFSAAKKNDAILAARDYVQWKNSGIQTKQITRWTWMAFIAGGVLTVLNFAWSIVLLLIRLGVL